MDRSPHRPWTVRVIGDIHGCHTELVALLRELGYQLDEDGARYPPMDGARCSSATTATAAGHAERAEARHVDGRGGHGNLLPGNHDIKLVRKLKGRDVQITHGLAETLEQLDAQPDEFREPGCEFLDKLVSHSCSTTASSWWRTRE